MPFVSVTRLRIRSLFFLPPFFLHTMRAQSQLKRAGGFRGGALLPDRRRVFWTMTLWDSQDAMRAYMLTGAHRTAMPHLLHWCDEASIVHWTQPEAALPPWPVAEARMRQEGRPSKLRHPAPHHDTLAFAPARVTVTTAIRPDRADG
jgi:hypothetical protein